MKNLAIQFDGLIKEGGIGAALFFVIVNLIYVNARSLYWLDGGSPLSWIPAIVGSVAYSITTIVVMRRAGHKALKIVFPLFDTALVLLGYNVDAFSGATLNPDKLNPVILALSIFFALFTGFITYSLGLLNYEQHEADTESKTGGEPKSDFQSNFQKSEVSESNFQTDFQKSTGAESDFQKSENLKSNFQTDFQKSAGAESDFQSNFQKNGNIESDFQTYPQKKGDTESNLTAAKSKIEQLESEISELKEKEELYYRSERGRILKKKPENRTEAELLILERTEIKDQSKEAL